MVQEYHCVALHWKEEGEAKGGSAQERERESTVLVPWVSPGWQKRGGLPCDGHETDREVRPVEGLPGHQAPPVDPQAQGLHARTRRQLDLGLGVRPEAQPVLGHRLLLPRLHGGSRQALALHGGGREGGVGALGVVTAALP